MGLHRATAVLAADGDEVTLPVRGYPAAAVRVTDDDWDSGGSVTVYLSWDDGATWREAFLVLDGESLATVSWTVSLPENARLLVMLAGPVTHLRVTKSGGTGAVTVDLLALEQTPVVFSMPVDGVGVGTRPLGLARVQGNVLDGGDEEGYPIKIGGHARTADRSAVLDSKRISAAFDKIGRAVVAPHCIPENLLKGKTGDITDTTAATVIVAQGGTTRIYVTHLALYNSHATVGTWVDILDDTTAIYTVYLAPAGGRAELALPVPLQLTANKALKVQCATTGANVRASASGYKGA